MLPKELSYAERFALARAAGFDGIEMQTIADADEAAEILAASKATGLQIHSVMNADHWRFPLSSSDGPTVARSVAGMETSLRNAALWGADVVLLVPAVVDAATSYRDAWTRSQRVIRERLLPMASELNVVIAVEEVWNKFLLSPLEFARYVDEFDSPRLKAYFDVGNVVFYGFPQDWIRVLGAAHRQGPPQGFPARSPKRPVLVEKPRRRGHRLAGGPAGIGRRRVCRIRDDRSRRRRRAPT